MDPRIKPVWHGAAVAGPALTVKAGKGDNLALHVAIANNDYVGNVLVVDASAMPDVGYFGEILMTASGANDVAGLVIDGGVRDVAALEANEFPVFSSVVALPSPSAKKGGTIGKVITVGGVEVAPGDWVVADADGCVVIPKPQLEAILEAGNDRYEAEQSLFRELREGRTTIDLLNLDPKGLDK